MGNRRGLNALRLTALIAAACACLSASPAAAATVALPPATLTIPSSGTFLYMNSQPGDYIGGGQEHLYTSADSAINGNLSGGYFSASVIQGAYTHWWYVNLAAPAGQPLSIGSYEGAVRWPFQPPGSPGLSIYGDGRGCNTLTGRFDVNALEYAPTGELLVFEADFEQHCEGGSAALFGRIRIENAPPPPDESPPVLHLPADITVEAPDAAGTEVWYSASATDDRDPTPSIACDPAAGSFFTVGTTTVTCTAEDRSGNSASGSFLVNVLPPLRFALTLDATGSVNPKTGVATVSGTVECSRSLEVWIAGELTQLFARRVAITGSISMPVSCTAPSTAWSVEVTGMNGLFVPGGARLRGDAWGCELSCHFANASSELRLRGQK